MADTPVETGRSDTRPAGRADRGGGASGLRTPRGEETRNALLEEFAQRWFVEGDGPGRGTQDVVAASETVAALWLTAVGLGPDAR